MTIDIYTDGGCSGNPGPGAWAYVILAEGEIKTFSGFQPGTTNNRMELSAVISALKDVAGFSRWQDAELRVFTDSQYVQKGMTTWIAGWVRNGWMTKAKQPVKNRDLWMELSALATGRVISWHWVRGHVGNEYNEMCDSLVQKEISQSS